MGNQILVIGNGFDLAINAKTSYGSFFESKFFQTKRDKAFRWIDLCGPKGMSRSCNLMDFEDVNCWELLFCLESKGCLNTEKKIKWCDVERVLYKSLTNTNNDSFSWELVRQNLYNRFKNIRYQAGDPIDRRWLDLVNCDKSITIVAEFLFQRGEWEAYCVEKTLFYEKLLVELNMFEDSFGVYIKQETKDDRYRNDAWDLVERLLGTRVDVQIDSFNYSDFSNTSTWIRHINGGSDAPIFGIDLSKEEEEKFPELRRFTKTSRRLHQDFANLNRSTVRSKLTVDKAVVFGHSLNRMDYDYFFYLFTTLRFHTFDLERMGSLQFVYKNYDPTRIEKIRNGYADSVEYLLSYYENSIGRFHDHILINLLRFSGKLTFRELN